MALAHVSRVVGVTPDPLTSSIDALMEVVFSGNEVPAGSEVRQVHVFVNELVTPSALRTLIADAVVDEASTLGFVMSATQVIMPAWQKGV